MPLSAEHLDTLDRLDREILELQYQGQRLRLWLTLRAGFKPSQPRWLSGHDGAGRWSGGPGIGHNSEPSGVDHDFAEEPPEEVESFKDRMAIGILQTLIDVAGAAAVLGLGVLALTSSSTASDDSVDAMICASGKRPSDFIPPGIGPGPYTKAWIPAGPGDGPSILQKGQINSIGSRFGCHTCGTITFGTPSGNPFADHQPSTAFRTEGPQFYLPHCHSCSNGQGGRVSGFKSRFKPSPEK